MNKLFKFNFLFFVKIVYNLLVRNNNNKKKLLRRVVDSKLVIRFYCF